MADLRTERLGPYLLEDEFSGEAQFGADVLTEDR